MTLFPDGLLKLAKAADDTSRSWGRRQVLSSIGLRVPKLAMEIGAFDNPTVRPSDGFEVRYIDHFSADELRVLHAKNERRRLDRLVNVDYVIKEKSLSAVVREKADLLVANHVVEHLCNPIAWLRDAAAFCNADAVIFMAVPDQRYTFDVLKQPTDVTDIVRWYESGKAMPDAHDVARMRFSHVRADSEALWRGESPPRPVGWDRSYRQHLERARAETEKGYVDVHCTFYSAPSFIAIYEELYRSGYIPWRVELVQGARPGTKEFYVLFRRGT